MTRLVVFVSLLLLSSVQASSLTIKSLQDTWPELKPGLVFKEVRYDSLLDLEIEYQGKLLSYQADSFTVEYSHPNPLKVSLDSSNQILLIENPEKKQEVPLERIPQVVSFIKIFDLILSGEFSELEQEYRVDLTQMPQDEWQIVWSLRGFLSNQPRKIVLSGLSNEQETQLIKLRVDLTNGDSRVFNFTAAN